jgi:hypothetical protein
MYMTEDSNPELLSHPSIDVHYNRQKSPTAPPKPTFRPSEIENASVHYRISPIAMEYGRLQEKRDHTNDSLRNRNGVSPHSSSAIIQFPNYPTEDIALNTFDENESYSVYQDTAPTRSKHSVASNYSDFPPMPTAVAPAHFEE